MSLPTNSHLALSDCFLSAAEIAKRKAEAVQQQSAAEQQRQFDDPIRNFDNRNAWRAVFSRLKPYKSYEEFCEQVADWSVEQLHAERDLLRRARS